jgi:hypothetical protein
VKHEDHLAEVRDDIERVLGHALQMRELMKHTLDLDPGGRGPGDGREEDPAVGIANRQREARLERFHGDLAMFALMREPFVTDWER